MAETFNRLYEFGPFRIDLHERALLREGELVPLAPKVFDTLLVLIEEAGRIVEKEQLMQAVWPDTFVEEANLTVNVSALRKALGDGSGVQYIETVPRRGYRFIAPVRRLEPQLVIREQRRASILVEEQVASTAAIFLRSKAFLTACSVVLLSGILSAYFLLRSSEGDSQVRSIAVLPFKPLVAENRDESLEMGMADALITRLGNLGRLVIRPTSSVAKYVSPTQDPVAIGRELRVDVLLDGRIQRADERVRVTVQLIRIKDGKHLWAGQFDEKFTDILKVEDAISERLASALILNLTGEQRKLLTKRYTESTDAYQLYQRGRYLWNKRNNRDLGKAIGYFDQAIRIDPVYALAHAGLADCYNVQTVYSRIESGSAYPKAKAAAARALELDDMLAEAHTSLAYAKLKYDWDWGTAEREFRRSIELNPNYATAHQWLSECLAATGRLDEALAEAQHAQELDPTSLIIDSHVGWIHYLMRQYDQAIAVCRKTLEVEPDFVSAHVYLGLAYTQKGMFPEAVSEYQAASKRNVEPDPLLWHAYARWGKSAEAKKGLAALTGASPISVALIHLAMRDKESSLRWLERGISERDDGSIYLRVDPLWDELRSDRRFVELLERTGLTG